MKLICMKVGDQVVVGVNHDGRIERVLVSEHPDLERARAIAQRMVHAFNLCDGLSDKSVELLAGGGGSSGNMPERVVAWSLFTSSARPSANKLLQKAREIIAKRGKDVIA